MGPTCNSINNGPYINNPTDEHTIPCKEPDNSQRNKEDNSEQRVNEKGVSVHRNGDHKSKDGDGCMRMRFGRKIKKTRQAGIQDIQTLHIITTHSRTISVITIILTSLCRSINQLRDISILFIVITILFISCVGSGILF